MRACGQLCARTQFCVDANETKETCSRKMQFSPIEGSHFLWMASIANIPLPHPCIRRNLMEPRYVWLDDN